MTLACVALMAMMAGCATKGPSDEQQIRDVVNGFKAALLAKDVAKTLSFVSEAFSHDQVPDKPTAKGYLEMGISEGYTDGAQVDLSQMKIIIDKAKKTAEAYPIIASADRGEVTAALLFTKESKGDAKVWMITSIRVEGI